MCSLYKSLSFCRLAFCPKDGMIYITEAFQFHEVPSIHEIMTLDPKESCSESLFFCQMSSRLLPTSNLPVSVYLVFIKLFYTFGAEFIVHGDKYGHTDCFTCKHSVCLASFVEDAVFSFSSVHFCHVVVVVVVVANQNSGDYRYMAKCMGLHCNSIYQCDFFVPT